MNIYEVVFITAIVFFTVSVCVFIKEDYENTFYTVTCPIGVYKHISASGRNTEGKRIIPPSTCLWEEE